MVSAGGVFDLYPEGFGQIVTFGAPPPFYEAGAEAFAGKNVMNRAKGEALGYRVLRVVNRRDIVSWIPHVVGLRHVGELRRVGPPTILGRIAACGAWVFDLISGNETWSTPPVYNSGNPDNPLAAEEIRRWSERETLRVAWRDWGFQIIGIHVLRAASIVLVPLWLTIYLIARWLALMPILHRLAESGMRHLRRNYLVALELTPGPRPAWHKTVDDASGVGHR